MNINEPSRTRFLRAKTTRKLRTEWLFIKPCFPVPNIPQCLAHFIRFYPISNSLPRGTCIPFWMVLSLIIGTGTPDNSGGMLQQLTLVSWCNRDVIMQPVARHQFSWSQWNNPRHTKHTETLRWIWRWLESVLFFPGGLWEYDLNRCARHLVVVENAAIPNPGWCWHPLSTSGMSCRLESPEWRLQRLCVCVWVHLFVAHRGRREKSLNKWVFRFKSLK